MSWHYNISEGFGVVFDMLPAACTPRRCRCACHLKRDRLKGPTTFQQNFALWGGAIYNQLLPSLFNADSRFTYKTPVLAYPDDTIFEDNSAQVRARPHRRSINLLE